jgi:hypothetical protein
MISKGITRACQRKGDIVTDQEKDRLLSAAQAAISDIDDISIFDTDEDLFMECDDPRDGAWVKAWIWVAPAEEQDDGK